MTDREAVSLEQEHTTSGQQALRLLFLSVLKQCVDDAQSTPWVLTSFIESKDFRWYLQATGFEMDYKFKRLVSEMVAGKRQRRNHPHVNVGE